MGKGVSDARMTPGGIIGWSGAALASPHASRQESSPDCRIHTPGGSAEADAAVRLSIVIPVYNESAHIRTTYRRIAETLATVSCSAEIVFVDDGSRDDTGKILSALSALDPRVHVIQLLRNAGQHQATVVGLEASSGDIVLTLDADICLTDSLLERVLDTFDEHPKCDVISVARHTRSRSSIRKFGSCMVTWLTNYMCSSNLQDPGSTFKAVRRPIVDLALQHDILAQYFPMFVTHATKDIIELSSSVPQVDRPSRYNLPSLVMTLMLAVLTYSRGTAVLAWSLALEAFIVAAGLAAAGCAAVLGLTGNTTGALGWLLAGMGMFLAGSFGLTVTTLVYKLESLIRNNRMRQIPMRRYIRNGHVVDPPAAAGRHVSPELTPSEQEMRKRNGRFVSEARAAALDSVPNLQGWPDVSHKGHTAVSTNPMPVGISNTTEKQA